MKKKSNKNKIYLYLLYLLIVIAISMIYFIFKESISIKVIFDFIIFIFLLYLFSRIITKYYNNIRQNAKSVIIGFIGIIFIWMGVYSIINLISISFNFYNLIRISIFLILGSILLYSSIKL